MGLQVQITKLNMNYDDDMQRFRNGTALAHLHGFWALQEWIAGNIEGSDPEGNAFIVSTELSLDDIARAYEDISKQYGHTHKISGSVPIEFFEDNELREVFEYNMTPLRDIYQEWSDKVEPEERVFAYGGDC